jgi:Domain of unknown function (DUF6532)
MGYDDEDRVIHDDIDEDTGTEQVDSFSHGSGVGAKRSHYTTSADSEWRQPVKIHATRAGAKPKAGDYEAAVQNILSSTISIYHGYLCTVTPYPDPMEEIRWAKRAWKAECEECEAKILNNGEIIALVWFSSCVYQFYSNVVHLQITSQGSHFRGQVKTKVSHHFKGMYGFVTSTKPAVLEQNVKLARNLKTKFAFAYAVHCHIILLLCTHFFTH